MHESFNWTPFWDGGSRKFRLKWKAPRMHLWFWKLFGVKITEMLSSNKKIHEWIFHLAAFLGRFSRKFCSSETMHAWIFYFRVLSTHNSRNVKFRHNDSCMNILIAGFFGTVVPETLVSSEIILRESFVLEPLCDRGSRNFRFERKDSRMNFCFGLLLVTQFPKC